MELRLSKVEKHNQKKKKKTKNAVT